METALLFAAQFLVGGTNTLLNKRFQLTFTPDPLHFLVYNMINALLASVNFFLAVGGRISCTAMTLGFSAVFALVVMLSLCLHILALEVLTIPMYAVTSSAGGLLTSSLFGILFLREKATVFVFFAMAAVLAAVLLPWAAVLRKHQRLGKRQVLLCAAVFCTAGLGSILSKLYTVTPGTSPSNQYFLMTNLLILLLSALATAGHLLRSRTPVCRIFRLFRPVQLANMAGMTLASNLGSVISITLLARMALSGYNILSTSVSMAATFCLSVLVFREKPGLSQLISALLVVAATALYTL